MVPVIASRFDLKECNSEAEREFVEALHARAEAGGWSGESLLWPDRVNATVCRVVNSCVRRTLRVDFGVRGRKYGDDETHQVCTELCMDIGATDLTNRPPAKLAMVAADWLEAEMSGW